MTFEELVQSTLETVTNHAFRIKLDSSSEESKPTSYVTWFEYQALSALTADGKELEREHHIQVNIFDKINTLPLSRQIEAAMINSGFMLEMGRDMPYEKDTGLFHKILRFNKEENIC